MLRTNIRHWFVMIYIYIYVGKDTMSFSEKLGQLNSKALDFTNILKEQGAKFETYGKRIDNLAGKANGMLDHQKQYVNDNFAFDEAKAAKLRMHNKYNIDQSRKIINYIDMDNKGENFSEATWRGNERCASDERSVNYKSRNYCLSKCDKNKMPESDMHLCSDGYWTPLDYATKPLDKERITLIDGTTWRLNNSVYVLDQPIMSSIRSRLPNMPSRLPGGRRRGTRKILPKPPDIISPLLQKQ